MSSRSSFLPTVVARAVLALGTLAAGTAGAAAVAPTADLANWTCAGACRSSAADGDITLSPTGNARHGVVSTFGSSATGVSPLALDPNNRGGGVETNGSRWVSGLFNANANDSLSMFFNYVSTDGKGYDDYAWARLLDANGSLVAWLFAAESTNSGTGNIVPGKVVDKKDFDPDEVIVDYKDWAFNSKTVDDPIDWSPLGDSNGTCWRDNAAGCGYTGWLQSRVTLPRAGSYRVEVGVVNWGDGAYDSGLAFDFATLRDSGANALPGTVPEPGTLALLSLALGGLGVVTRRQAPRS